MSPKVRSPALPPQGVITPTRTATPLPEVQIDKNRHVPVPLGQTSPKYPISLVFGIVDSRSFQNGFSGVQRAKIPQHLHRQLNPVQQVNH